MYVTKRDGSLAPLDPVKYEKQIDWACSRIPGLDPKVLKSHVKQTFFDGIKTTELNKNLERHAQELATPEAPGWTFVAAAVVLQDIHKEVGTTDFKYPSLRSYLESAIETSNMNPFMLQAFDMEVLEAAIQSERDAQFDYLGISTIKDRYLLRNRKTKQLIEMPQHFLMRVAMGVALDEANAEFSKIEINANHVPDLSRATKIAVDYYETLSNFEFMSSTPTLFNAGLNKSQLSSCFGISMTDDFDGIWDSLKECGAYSKYGGGVAMDITDLRGEGAPIRSMGGEAGGPIPFVKLLNDTILAFDQQGKRKGVAAPYMENWHVNFYEFLNLREPGEDRLRAHDVFPANWISDLFMERLLDGGFWSFFDPIDAPDLHGKWGAEFEAAYIAYEKAGVSKKMVPADEVWTKMLTRLMAHGVFWMNFKDRMNERNPMRSKYPIRSSNLCTEIALHSSETYSFVCNLGSINVGQKELLLKKGPDGKYIWNMKLAEAAMRGIRFLDSVISVGFVPSERGRNMQRDFRPVGMGVMGWTVALYEMGIDYESKEHIEYANEVMKQISVAAMYQSALLGKEKGSFPLFKDSTWAQGILTHETLVNRSIVEDFDLDLSFDHCPFVKEDELKKMVSEAMRNCNLLAIAPTATIANIVGTEACTELPFKLVFNKKNLSGPFETIAKTIERNPHGLPIKTAYDVNHLWTVDAAAARGIWIDQTQSTNYMMDTTTPDAGDRVDALYVHSYKRGLKTNYYLYGKSEEKKTVKSVSIDSVAQVTVDAPQIDVEGRFCSIDAGPDCEACQ
jgi:ribonucleoside-diphosphate reductase alpha chain